MLVCVSLSVSLSLSVSHSPVRVLQEVTSSQPQDEQAQCGDLEEGHQPDSGGLKGLPDSSRMCKIEQNLQEKQKHGNVLSHGPSLNTKTPCVP